MQTFLPYPDYVDSVRCLDWRRLGKQRVEAWQILRALQGIKKGWANHPAVKMWRGHEAALAQYMNICIREWKRRGYRNNMQEIDMGPALPPSWLYATDICASHRSNLLRKDPVYYGQFGWTEPPDLPYVWPTREAA